MKMPDKDKSTDEQYDGLHSTCPTILQTQSSQIFFTARHSSMALRILLSLHCIKFALTQRKTASGRDQGTRQDCTVSSLVVCFLQFPFLSFPFLLYDVLYSFSSTLI